MNATTERIRRIVLKCRDEQGHSNTVLARMAGVNRSDLSRFLGGKLSEPKLEFMERLLTALGVPLNIVYHDSLEGVGPSRSAARYKFTADELEFMLYLRSLTAADRAILVAMAKRLRPRRGGAAPPPPASRR